MKTATLVVLLALTACVAKSYDLSMFWCGFSGSFCGQSNSDDVNPKSTTVIMAFVNTQPDGSVIADTNFPTTLVTKWKRSGKKVIISVGGEHGNWQNVFASPTNTRNFIASLSSIVRKYKLDGVDLDIENYSTPPRTVANMILALRSALGTGKLIIVSPENVTVLQQCAVPSADVVSGWCNYFVPIIQLADSAIDFYQPQAYNNWYEVSPGTLAYLQNVYLNWRNLQGLTSWAKPIVDFKGVHPNKLLIGVMASPVAGGASHYYSPSIITEFKSWLQSENYPLRGFMMWDSNWDALNSYVVSTACTA